MPKSKEEATKTMQQALEFYADPRNWEPGDAKKSQVDYDSGRLARAALAGVAGAN